MANEQTKKNGKVILTDVRCAFPHLFTAKAATSEVDARKRYSITLLIPKETEEGKALYKKVKAEIDRIKKEKEKVTFKPSRICLKDGDKDETAKPEYKGHWFLNANRNESQGGPEDPNGLSVVDRKKVPVPASKAGMFYGGCWVSVVLGIFYTSKGGDAIPASLEVVQFRKDDEKFGNGSTASADDLPDDDPDADDNLDADDDSGLGDDD